MSTARGRAEGAAGAVAAGRRARGGRKVAGGRLPGGAGVALALWLAIGTAGATAQEPADRTLERLDGVGEPPSGVRFRLEEPRPNPFQDRVELSFVLGEGPQPRRRSSVTSRDAAQAADGPGEQAARARVSIRIYNLLHERVAWAVVPPGDRRSGRRVRDLPYELPGRYVAVWDGRAEDGYRVMSGPYFVELVVDGRTAVRKVLLTR